MSTALNPSVSSHFINVLGSRMHYLRSGDVSKPVILFVHGMPTSSYLWRNILPDFSDQACCIAIDLIGMGKSDKPDIAYTVFDHIRYFDAFVSALGLQDITLVVHGWGSVIALDHARRHEQNIAALAFYESHLRPIIDWQDLSLPVQQLGAMLKDQEASYEAVVEGNYFINRVLPEGVVIPMSPGVLSEYAAPFQTEASRKLLWQYLMELPLGQRESDVISLITAYSQWLAASPQPKLLLYAIPGFITTVDTVAWAKDAVRHVELVCLEDALHFAQESMPDVFSSSLSQWWSHTRGLV